MNKKTIIVSIIVLIAVAGLSFYAGQVHANKKRQSNTPNFQGGFRTTGGANNRMISGRAAGTNLIMGTVVAKDDTSITIKDRTGGSKIIFFTGTTPVGKTATGTLDDVIIGKEITITGTANPEGSVSASSIQVR
ncbi:MAG: hypothetical protein V4665_02890 [Patescibacteria group bacterium]